MSSCRCFNVPASSACSMGAQVLLALLPQSRRELIQRRPEVREEPAEDLFVAIRRWLGRGFAEQPSPSLAALFPQAFVPRSLPRPLFQQRAEQIDELGPGSPRFQFATKPIHPEFQDVRCDRARLGLVEQDLEVHHLRVQRLARRTSAPAGRRISDAIGPDLRSRRPPPRPAVDTPRGAERAADATHATSSE